MADDYKSKFINDFAALFTSPEARVHSMGHGITGMEYDPEKEVVSVYFGDTVKKVNVWADSLSAMVYDILTQALGY